MGWPWGPVMGTVPKWVETGGKRRTEPWTHVMSHKLREETSWTINYNKKLFFPCLRNHNIKLIYGNYGISIFMSLSELYKERRMI